MTGWWPGTDCKWSGSRCAFHLLEPDDENSLAAAGWLATDERTGATLPVHRLTAVPQAPAELVTRTDARGAPRWIDGVAAGPPEGALAFPSTHAERVGWSELTPHDEVVAFYRALAAGSPAVQMTEIGRSREGRPLHLVTLSGSGVKSPWEAHASGKPILFIGAQVHGDEPAGKEALMRFARDLTHGPLEHLLDEVVFLLVPQMNPDGAEAGEWGMRANAARYNLNRDYLRLDNPEALAVVEEVLVPWRPHVVVDAHELGGPPRVYDFYTWHPTNPHGPRAPMDLSGQSLIPAIVEALEANDYSHIIYHTPGGLAQNPEGGIFVPVYGRTLNDYAGSQGMATILFESLRERDARVGIEDRARRQYVAMEALAGQMATDAVGVIQAFHEGRRELHDLGTVWDEADELAVRREPAASRTIDYEVAELVEVETDEGTQREWTGGTITVQTPLYDIATVTLARTRPVGYVIEPQRGDLVAQLLTHGVRVEEVLRETEWEVEVYRIDELDLSGSLYEGYVPQRFETTPEAETRTVAPGSYLVRMNQPGAALVAHLMEPEDENSFAITGEFLTEARPGRILPVYRVREIPPVPVRQVQEAPDAGP